MNHQDPQTEAALLALFVQHPDTFTRYSYRIAETHFTSAGNIAVYAAMDELSRRGMAVNYATVSGHLRSTGQIAQAGGEGYIRSLSQTPLPADSAETLVALLDAHRTARGAASISSALSAAMAGTAEEAHVAAAAAETELAELLAGTRASEPVLPSEMVSEVMEQVDRQMRTEDGVSGLRTNIPTLDYNTCGLHPTEFTVIGARPAMGKTAFALTLARNSHSHSNVPVLFFSLEMGAQQLVTRMAVAEAGLDNTDVRRGDLDSHELGLLMAACDRVSKSQIYIDDSPGITSSEIAAKTRRYVRDKGVGLVIVDYLQLVSAGRKSKSGNREQEIAAISRAFKQLAKHCKIPLVALAQLSRTVETRSDKRPNLRDLRESGAIEQDADNVMFLYRPEYYGINTDEAGASTEGICEVIIAKQRNGPTSTVPLHFDRRKGEFRDLPGAFIPPRKRIHTESLYEDEMGIPF